MIVDDQLLKFPQHKNYCTLKRHIEVIDYNFMTLIKSKFAGRMNNAYYNKSNLF